MDVHLSSCYLLRASRIFEWAVERLQWARAAMLRHFLTFDITHTALVRTWQRKLRTFTIVTRAMPCILSYFGICTSKAAMFTFVRSFPTFRIHMNRKFSSLYYFCTSPICTADLHITTFIRFKMITKSSYFPDPLTSIPFTFYAMCTVNLQLVNFSDDCLIQHVLKIFLSTLRACLPLSLSVSPVSEAGGTEVLPTADC